jgi:hypothetical protein
MASTTTPTVITRDLSTFIKALNEGRGVYRGPAFSLPYVTPVVSAYGNEFFKAPIYVLASGGAGVTPFFGSSKPPVGKVWFISQGHAYHPDAAKQLNWIRRITLGGTTYDIPVAGQFVANTNESIFLNRNLVLNEVEQLGVNVPGLAGSITLAYVAYEAFLGEPIPSI